MELSELTEYAAEKYQMREEHKWSDFPGFSVLCHPQTGKWIALLMRQWDTDTGTEIQRCDLKCGAGALPRPLPAYLTPPLRMRGARWVGVCFDGRTESDVVLRLLDQAVALGTGHGFTVVLEAPAPRGDGGYRDTALPLSGGAPPPEKPRLPERLREMRRLYEYGSDSPAARARNFARQAAFMADYEDDRPWPGGDFVRYFPTYHDLDTAQLRGYFGWRTRARRGEFGPIPASAAYLYVYELLNGVGAAGPEEALDRLREFERGFVDAGFGDARMRTNLRRWMLEFCVLKDLPPETARRMADPETEALDGALSVLRSPADRTDEEAFAALCFFGGKKTENSPVLAADPERGRRLFAAAWRAASAYRREDRDLFTLCFGRPAARRWYPLSNAVYHETERPAGREYALNDCRRYRCSYGVWQTEAYEKLNFDRALIQGFVHETDARLRRWLKTGRYLKENAADAWAIPYVDAVIEEEKKAALEAARPRITIDLSGLDRIRRDAAVTRESLLTQDEIDGADEPKIPEGAGSTEAPAPPEEPEESAGPLDPVQTKILRALLAGEDAAEILKKHRMMPSLTADAINEALYDEIGDTVLLCEDDRLLLVDDYLDDLTQILGGTNDG